MTIQARFALAFASIALAALAANAAPLKLDHLVFQPERFVAGEEVVVLAQLPGADAAGIAALSYRPGPPGREATEDPELREIRVYRTGSLWELRISFVPWSPGPASLPAWRSKGMLIPPIPYVAVSSLGPGMGDPRGLELAPPRPQADPPGTFIYIYGFAGLILLLVFAVLGSLAWLVPAARRILAKRRAAQAFRRLCRDMDWLASRAAGSDPVSFYSAIARALRIYLAERVGPIVPSLSAYELSSLPPGSFPGEGVQEAAAFLISETEEVRYAGRRPLPEDMEMAVARARSVGSKTEEALDARL